MYCNIKCTTMFVSPATAKEHYHVSYTTLKRWAKDGQIESFITKGGHRRYKIKEANGEEKDTRRKFIYARVSSRKQEGDLDRQVAELIHHYPDFEVEKDIGSGLSTKRPGFRRILECLFQGNCGTVVCASNDRFSRLGGREFFQWIFQKFNAQLLYLHESELTDEEAFVADVMEVITIFSAKFNGKRANRNSHRRKKISLLPKRITKKVVS